VPTLPEHSRGVATPQHSAFPRCPAAAETRYPSNTNRERVHTAANRKVKPLPTPGTTESEIRRKDLPPTEYVGGIPLYPVGGVVFLYGPPGIGKSFIQQGLNHTITWGKPLGDWQPEVLSDVLYCDFEGNERLTKERSIALTPFGHLASDTGGKPMTTDTTYLFSEDFTGRTFPERVAELEDQLMMKEQAGPGHSLVILDTFQYFTGSKPNDQNAYEYDRECISVLNKLAEKFQVCIVVIHHPNKSGEMSGSVGRAGTAFMVLRFTKTSEEEAVLETEKNRVGPEFEYVFNRDRDRVWRLSTDVHPRAALQKGNYRAIVGALVQLEGRATLEDLRGMTGLKEGSLRSGLYRLSQRFEVEHRDGYWHTCFDATIPTLNSYKVPAWQPWPKCATCGGAEDPDYGCCNMQCAAYRPDARDPQAAAAALGGHTIRVQREQWPEEELPADDAPREAVPEIRPNTAIRKMIEVVSDSRLHAVFKIDEQIKAKIPYSAVALGGAGNQWALWPKQRPAANSFVVSFDRKASYYSSNPWLVPNVLSRRGPMQWSEIRGEKLAGMFEVIAPSWSHSWLPNPLGINVKTHQRVLATRNTLNRLAQLQREGLIEFPTILSGYVGKGSENLLEPWFQWCLEQRRSAPTQAEADARKADQNTAIGCLRIVDEEKNPGVIDRPDWHYAIVSLHYAMMNRFGIKSLKAGETLLALGNTDEMVYLVPEGEDPSSWVPETLREHLKAKRFDRKYVAHAPEWWERGGRHV
jgi:hypothetical protein